MKACAPMAPSQQAARHRPEVASPWRRATPHGGEAADPCAGLGTVLARSTPPLRSRGAWSPRTQHRGLAQTGDSAVAESGPARSAQASAAASASTPAKHRVGGHASSTEWEVLTVRTSLGGLLFSSSNPSCTFSRINQKEQNTGKGSGGPGGERKGKSVRALTGGARCLGSAARAARITARTTSRTDHRDGRPAPARAGPGTRAAADFTAAAASAVLDARRAPPRRAEAGG